MWFLSLGLRESSRGRVDSVQTESGGVKIWEVCGVRFHGFGIYRAQEKVAKGFLLKPMGSPTTPLYTTPLGSLLNYRAN